ncbi:MAG: beta-N-acetylhexosaminidase [Opitutales bacterium]
MSETPGELGVLPRPEKLRRHNGSFRLSEPTRIQWAGGESQSVAELLAGYLRPATGFPLPVEEETQRHEPAIVLRQTGDDPPDDAGFFDETYRLSVSEQGVELSSPSAAGLARGIQTLRQLFPSAIYAPDTQREPWVVPCVDIEDRPACRWRGMHLDVVRHFFDVDTVCRFIELLAIHRFNVCHLHLTDDQGWRLEIEKYPKLTEIGSKRKQTLVGHERTRPRQYDGVEAGGFFTRAQAREIVAFAARRHVTVVPEIEMPGHSQAAIASYPELGNTGCPIEPRCHWGVSQHVLNVEDATVGFMKDVLDETIDLFPSRFIHVGGDEVPRTQWSESPRAQQRMRELGLTSEDQLQSWFIQQVDRHLAERGRRLIGWDEILEGGLAPGATVMSWRGEEGGITTARQGHDVVMAPSSHIYFDHYQSFPREEEPLAIGGMSSTDFVYSYQPLPAGLEPELHRHVLGAQGQLWSEYIPDRDHLDYMAFPRASALAEALWLEPDAKDYADFLRRLAVHRQRFTQLRVNAHPRP